MLAKKVKTKIVTKILKDDCNLTFKLTKKYKYDVYEPQLKFKRHFFAEQVIQFMEKGKRILNWDETDIGHS